MLTTRFSPGRLLAVVALLALACNGLVFACRLAAVHEAANIPPGTVQTSGCEEESFFAVWRKINGRPVYGDVTKPPYASASFNWLFYATYGTILRPVVEAYGDSYLPLAGHWLTAVFAVLGSVGCTWACVRSQENAAARLAGAAIGSLLFLGPLVGWWGVTLRPDVAALLAELVGILVFLYWHRTQPKWAVAVAVMTFYLAWAFKPTTLGAFFAVAAFLLAHRRWGEAAFFGGATVALWLLTLAIGGPVYRASLLETATNNTFSVSAGAANLWLVLRALAPLLVGLPWWLGALRRHRPWRQRSLPHDALLLSTLGLLIVTVAFSVAASKIGATKNYFFTAGLLLTIGTVLGVWPLQRTRLAPALACALTLFVQGGLLAGLWGTLSLRANAEQLAARWTVFQRLPEPRFSHDLRLNLPWLNRQSPPLVLAFDYPRNRAEGRRFAGDGLGGMIVRGELATLLLPAEVHDRYDGATLNNYVRGETVAGLAVYRRRSEVLLPR
jgi:hypothetical protein